MLMHPGKYNNVPTSELNHLYEKEKRSMPAPLVVFRFAE